MAKDPLPQVFVAAYERSIAASSHANQRGMRHQDGWGAPAVVVHLAGCEVMARVRISQSHGRNATGSV
ncbi:MAG TPA: hypothetical protein VF807_07180 [Ktedonobacterales bacterium]